MLSQYQLDILNSFSSEFGIHLVRFDCFAKLRSLRNVTAFHKTDLYESPGHRQSFHSPLSPDWGFYHQCGLVYEIGGLFFITHRTLIQILFNRKRIFLPTIGARHRFWKVQKPCSRIDQL